MANNPNNVIRRDGVMPYSYTPSNCSGEIYIGGETAPAHVHITDPDDESTSYAMQLHHPNYLCLNFVHRKGNVKTRRFKVDPLNAKPDIRVHSGAEHTYEQYIEQLQMERITPVSCYSREDEDAKYYHVPNEYKMLIKGAVQLFLHMHSKNGALKDDDLTTKNLKITNGKLLIVGVDFDRVDDKNMDKCFKKDWSILSRLISRDILKGYEDEIPEDMQYLLHSMLSFNSFVDDEKYMKNPLALMTDREIRKFIKNCWESRREIESRTLGGTYIQVVTHMGDYTHWIDDLFYNEDKHVFNYVLQTFESPVNNQPGGRNIYKDLVDKDANFEVLKCARNMATHLNKRFGDQEHFGDRDQANMLMLTFGKMLTAIHHGFCLNGLLHYVVKS